MSWVRPPLLYGIAKSPPKWLHNFTLPETACEGSTPLTPSPPKASPHTLTSQSFAPLMPVNWLLDAISRVWLFERISLTHSLNKHLLSGYYVPGTIRIQLPRFTREDTAPSC